MESVYTRARMLLRMLLRVLIVGAFVLLSAPVESVARAASGPPLSGRDQLQIAHCTRSASEYIADLTDTLLLARPFLDGKTDDELIHTSILLKLRYLWGYVRTDEDMHEAMALVLSAEEPEIQILEK